MCGSNDFHNQERPAAQVVRSDLCAQLAPLDRYGLAGFSAALVDGFRALFGASRRAPAQTAVARIADGRRPVAARAG